MATYDYKHPENGLNVQIFFVFQGIQTIVFKHKLYMSSNDEKKSFLLAMISLAFFTELHKFHSSCKNLATNDIKYSTILAKFKDYTAPNFFLFNLCSVYYYCCWYLSESLSWMMKLVLKPTNKSFDLRRNTIRSALTYFLLINNVYKIGLELPHSGINPVFRLRMFTTDKCIVSW